MSLTTHRKTWKLALMGTKNSGKTCLLASMASGPAPHPKGYTIVWHERPRSGLPAANPTPTTGSLSSSKPATQADTSSGIELLRQAVQALRRGSVPPGTVLDMFHLQFTLSAAELGNADLDIVDYAGEFLNQANGTVDAWAKKLGEYLEDADALLILAETNGHDEETVTYTRNLQAAFTRLDEGGCTHSKPVALLLTKWDRRGPVDSLPADGGVHDFMATDPPQRNLENAIGKAVGPDNLRVFPVSAFGSSRTCEQDGSHREVPVLHHGQIRPYNLLEPLIWTVDRAITLQCLAVKEQVDRLGWWKFWAMPRSWRAARAAGQLYVNRPPTHQHRPELTMLRVTAISRFTGQCATTLLMLVFLTLTAEIGWDSIVHKQQKAVLGNSVALPAERLAAEAWYDNYATSPHWRHLGFQVFLGKTEARQMADDSRNLRDDQAWGPIPKAAVEDRAPLAKTYLAAFPFGRHASEAHVLVRLEDPRLRRNENQVWLDKYRSQLESLDVADSQADRKCQGLLKELENDASIPQPAFRTAEFIAAYGQALAEGNAKLKAIQSEARQRTAEAWLTDREKRERSLPPDDPKNLKERRQEIKSVQNDLDPVPPGLPESCHKRLQDLKARLETACTEIDRKLRQQGLVAARSAHEKWLGDLEGREQTLPANLEERRKGIIALLADVNQGPGEPLYEDLQPRCDKLIARLKEKMDRTDKEIIDQAKAKEKAAHEQWLGKLETHIRSLPDEFDARREAILPILTELAQRSSTSLPDWAQKRCDKMKEEMVQELDKVTSSMKVARLARLRARVAAHLADSNFADAASSLLVNDFNQLEPEIVAMKSNWAERVGQQLPTVTNGFIKTKQFAQCRNFISRIELVGKDLLNKELNKAVVRVYETERARIDRAESQFLYGEARDKKSPEALHAYLQNAPNNNMVKYVQDYIEYLNTRKTTTVQCSATLNVTWDAKYSGVFLNYTNTISFSSIPGAEGKYPAIKSAAGQSWNSPPITFPATLDSQFCFSVHIDNGEGGYCAWGSGKQTIEDVLKPKTLSADLPQTDGKFTHRIEIQLDAKVPQAPPLPDWKDVESGK